MVVFDTMSQMSYRLYGSGDPLDDNPFTLDSDTTQADIDAAYCELQSFRQSSAPDRAKWLWLEECLISAIMFATSMKLTADEINTAVESFEVPLSESQRALVLKWGLDHIEQCADEMEKHPLKDNQDLDAEVVKMIEEINCQLDHESLTRLGTAIHADDLLNQVLQKKS